MILLAVMCFFTSVNGTCPVTNAIRISLLTISINDFPSKLPCKNSVCPIKLLTFSCIEALLMGAVTSTSIFPSFNASAAFLIDSKDFSPLTVVASPNLTSRSSFQIFKRFALCGFAFSILLIILKLKSFISIAFLCFATTFDEPNTIGVQKSNILLSLKVLIIVSKPIPFKSPIEIPSLIFDIMLCF